jgi:hypothetical protein
MKSDQEMYNDVIKTLPQQGSQGVYTVVNGIILLNGKPIGVHGFAVSTHAWELFH